MLHAWLWLPRRLPPEWAVVWREQLRRQIWTNCTWFIHILDSADTTSGSTRVAPRWTLRLTLYSRYNSVVCKLIISRDSVGRYCRSALLRGWRLCRQREKLSYCQGTVEPVVHPWFRLLYEFAELHETLGTVVRAVKQTDHCHYGRRSGICCCRHSSLLRRWYLRCLLVDFPLFL